MENGIGCVLPCKVLADTNPMKHRFTRQELFDRIWSTPISHMAAELGTTAGRLSSLIRRAGIPTPPSGYWIKKEFGKAEPQPPLPPAPADCPEPLVLDTDADMARIRRLETAPHKAEPAQPPSEFEATSTPIASSLPPTPVPRPSQPTTVTREALYAAVWAKPMSRLAEQYGVSDNGLAKICRREGIPYPPRGYWAKHAAGKAPERTPLPKSDRASRPITIYPTPLPEPPPELPDDVRRQMEGIHAEASSSMTVSERLVKPHAIIAAWLADHEERKRRARQERDPWRKKLYDPGDFGDSDRRRHRFLDALFKAIERQGGKIKQGDRRELIAEVSGEDIEFQLREKQKQIRRPLSADEQRWRISGDKDWKQELAPTGRLTFEIKTYLPAGLKRQWLETDKQPLEDMLPDMFAVFIAAGPLLVQQRKEREAAERERQLAERRRYEEQQRRKCDANRWRHFREIALDWSELSAARDFLGTLRSMDVDPSIEIDGRSLDDWLLWTEDWLQRADPIANGAEDLFRRIAEITAWSYRD